jgi:hypothetical protein
VGDPVPDADELVLFFSHEDEWNEEERRPHRSVFRASDHQLSSWHDASLLAHGCSRRELCIERWDGAWEALLTPPDCRDAAGEVLSSKGRPAGLQAAVEFDPDGATGAWIAWAYAHASILTMAGSAEFPRTMQNGLRSRCVVYDAGGNHVPFER